MSHFYGTLQGNRGEATRQGTKSSGITTHTASWEGAVRVHAYYREDLDEDWVMVNLTYWHGAGTNEILYHGPIGAYEGRGK